MGTRHLICVKLDGEYKIAQYGQWDGYPEGAGLEVLKFLRERMETNRFTNNLRQTYLIDVKTMDKIIEEMNYHVPWSTIAKAFPAFDRDTGAEILDIVQAGKARMLVNQIDFAKDSLFCEWAYVIDLDDLVFQVYKGFNKTKLEDGDRFFFLQEDECQYDGFYPVREVQSWSLFHLPDAETFLKAFEKEDEDD